ncbi:chorismate synthase [Erysipelotrichaceae bacterium OttesenSCG-928-M19]|nr:chorismate synthase [Erysipelotrichaceae bacterium OttesenSCG-928-M19]
MKSSYNHHLKFEISGQSHSEEISLLIYNIQPGFEIDFDKIDEQLNLRQGNQSFNTYRQEKISYEIRSGFDKTVNSKKFKTDGQTIEIIFINSDIKSQDYDNILKQPRPGHVDYVASMKYGREHSIAGGGHFSARLTLPLVFVGSLIQQIVLSYYPTLNIVSHVKSFGNYNDLCYYELRKYLVDKIIKEDLNSLHDLDSFNERKLANFASKLTTNLHKIVVNGLSNEPLPTYHKKIGQQMLAKAKALSDDSLGGQIETIIINPPSFIGEPWFYSLESALASLMYSIPSIKEIAFGNSELFKNAYGSEVKDEIIYLDNRKLTTLYNHNGGINGGITNGEDIVFSTVIKPISSINQIQNTYHLQERKMTFLQIAGRHDKTVINRVIPIINALSYVAIYDLILANKIHDKIKYV